MIPPFTTRGDGDRVDLTPQGAIMNTRRSASLLWGVLLLGALPALHADILYSITDLGTLEGVCCSSGTGINNLGQVVGYSQTSTGSVSAFLYSNGQMTNLGTL